MSHYKDILRSIKYEIDTKDYCYQMKPDKNINGPWEILGYSDTDYAGDNDTRKIVTGYIVIINGAVISWSLWIQKTVTLSPLQKLNIQQSRRYIVKYYLFVQFYCVWELLLNIPLSYTLITLELYLQQAEFLQGIYSLI